MIPASQAKKAVPNTKTKERMPVADYLGQRIQESVDKGYSSTKAWLDASQFAEAEQVLNQNGYAVNVLQEDGARMQVGISWE